MAAAQATERPFTRRIPVRIPSPKSMATFVPAA